MQFLLQLESAHARHAQIGHDATFEAAEVLLEKLDRTVEDDVRQIHRFDEVDQKISHDRIVIDQINLRNLPLIIVCSHLAWPVGMTRKS